MNRIFRILEIVWMMIAIVGICMTAYFIIIQDNEGAIFFLIFTLVAGVIYSIRKRQRKKFDAAQKQNEQGK